MTVAWFVEYEKIDSEEWDSICFSLMDPDKIENGRRIHRMLKGLRHDRFQPNIQTMDDVYQGLGLEYLGPEKPAYDFELWAEIEPANEQVHNDQYVLDPQPVVPVSTPVPESVPMRMPAVAVGSEVLREALMPFAMMGVQLVGKWHDTEPYPGTIPVGWLRNAARALQLMPPNA